MHLLIKNQDITAVFYFHKSISITQFFIYVTCVIYMTIFKLAKVPAHEDEDLMPCGKICCTKDTDKVARLCEPFGEYEVHLGEQTASHIHHI
jgi:hypothetical protein